MALPTCRCSLDSGKRILKFHSINGFLVQLVLLPFDVHGRTFKKSVFHREEERKKDFRGDCGDGGECIFQGHSFSESTEGWIRCLECKGRAHARVPRVTLPTKTLFMLATRVNSCTLFRPIYGARCRVIILLEIIPIA